MNLWFETHLRAASFAVACLALLAVAGCRRSVDFGVSLTDSKGLQPELCLVYRSVGIGEVAAVLSLTYQTTESGGWRISSLAWESARTFAAEAAKQGSDHL